jgi:hypothetical protein
MRLLEKIDLEKSRPLKHLVNSCPWDVVALIFVMIDGGWGFVSIRSFAWLQLCPIEL